MKLRQIEDGTSTTLFCSEKYVNPLFYDSELGYSVNSCSDNNPAFNGYACALLGPTGCDGVGGNDSGAVLLTGEGVELPGLPLGLYRVRITGPADAELGCEIAEDGPTGGRLVFSF